MSERVDGPARRLPNERQELLRQLRLHKQRLDRAVRRLEGVENERTNLYVAARKLDPPMTYKAIADIYGVTEAAIMQKINRREAARSARAGKAKRPRT